jgi:sulfoquinovosyltransferase
LSDVFNPKHKSQSMRERMSDGHPDEPLLVYVGRLGAEKNTEALKDILTQVGADMRVCQSGKK